MVQVVLQVMLVLMYNQVDQLYLVSHLQAVVLLVVVVYLLYYHLVMLQEV